MKAERYKKLFESKPPIQKLLKLKLIQTKTYKKTLILNTFKIEDIEYRLKRSLQVIQNAGTSFV